MHSIAQVCLAAASISQTGTCNDETISPLSTWKGKKKTLAILQLDTTEGFLEISEFWGFFCLIIHINLCQFNLKQRIMVDSDNLTFPQAFVHPDYFFFRLNSSPHFAASWKMDFDVLAYKYESTLPGSAYRSQTKQCGYLHL